MDTRDAPESMDLPRISGREVTSSRRLWVLMAVAVFLGGTYVLTSDASPWAQPPAPEDVNGWSDRIELALKQGRADVALAELDRAMEKVPNNPQMHLIRGSLLFRSGKVEESLVDFDKCIELDPRMKPYLWQRGISLYYAGKYQDGVDQFVVHREVNPNDVENAFWHFLCAAKLDGVEAAQKAILLSGSDRRIPMMQVQELIQGKTTPEAVIEAAENTRKNIRGPDYDRFYGYLYVGLYYDVLGNEELAKKWIEKCVELKVDGYMGDVAKVHWDRMKDKR
jgi:lipoprotein NlpI